MIYDCCMFFNEFEILNIRLHELESVVDKFVIIESNKTFSNKPKSLFLQEKKRFFSRWSEKMIVVAATIDETAPVKIETAQRQAIWEVIKNHIKDQDIMMMSDVDEIPSASAVKIALGQIEHGDICFVQDVCQYYLNRRLSCSWLGTRMVTPGAVRNMGSSMHTLRYKTPTLSLCDAGWHFGYMGGAEQIKLKIQSFCHTELDQPQFTESEKINARIQTGADPFDRWKQSVEILPLHKMPKYVQDNPHIFASWLAT